MARRIAGLYLATTLLLLLALGGTLYWSTADTLVEARRAELAGDAALAASFLGRAVGREQELRTLAPILAANLPGIASAGRRLRVFSANGTLLVALPTEEGAGRPSRSTQALLPPSLLALAGRPEDNPALLYAAAAITGSTVDGLPGTIGVVEVAAPRTDIDLVLERLRGAFLLAAGLIGVLAAGAGLLLARSLTHPLQRLEATARAIAAGDLERRAEGLPANEIGALGDSFNAMSARLAQLLAEARQEERRLTELLARVHKMEDERTSMLRRLGHELRTPITALRTILANLSDDAAPAQAPPLATAEAEAARLGRLVDEILALAAGQAATPLNLQPTDLTALARAAGELFSGRAARLGVELVGPAPATPPTVVIGDHDRLRQVLVNLLDNALRHTPPGGLIELAVAAHDGQAHVTVRDNGSGMDEATQARAFEPHYSGDGSSGLGLAIVRELLTAHGGTVDLTSSPGMGTTVTVTIRQA